MNYCLSSTACTNNFTLVDILFWIIIVFLFDSQMLRKFTAYFVENANGFLKSYMLSLKRKNMHFSNKYIRKGMFMKRKLKSDRGFTLAELLIVVAIIGVLVAIAIPIFTSQLERSREAVDLSDVRSAYAEVMMAAITGDTSATYTKDSGQKIYKETDGTYSIMVTPLKQQKDDWQTPLPITIGGVSSNAGDTYWKGIPGPKGYCEITYHPLTSTGNEYVSFYWTGGTDNGNNTNFNSCTNTTDISYRNSNSYYTR